MRVKNCERAGWAQYHFFDLSCSILQSEVTVEVTNASNVLSLVQVATTTGAASQSHMIHIHVTYSGPISLKPCLVEISCRSCVDTDCADLTSQANTVVESINASYYGTNLK